MGRTSIEWCDFTFNPWWGCVKVSEACKHCYAESLSKRFGMKLWGPNHEIRTFGDKHWNAPVRWNKKAEEAGVRHRVFCASMADVFEGRDDLDEHRARLWALIEDTPNLDWLLLTKRPENIWKKLPVRWEGHMPENVWLGTTVESQATADERIPHLLAVPAHVRFLSMEPLVEEVDIEGFLPPFVDRLDSVHWVIAGGESGQKARPSHPDWFRSLRDQCKSGDVPFLFKQWGAFVPKSQTDEPCPKNGWGTIGADGTWWSQTTPWNGHDDDGSGEAVMYRLGKKVAGRVLDGRTWDEVPARSRFPHHWS